MTTDLPGPATPWALMQRELRRDAARPLVTFYDDATGERVELSVATFGNWVAKTAGLLHHGLSAESGERVALLLPAHWQSLAWASACWAVGARVVPGPPAEAGPSGGRADADSWAHDLAVVVSGPDDIEAARHSGAAEVVALALRPLGGRFVEPLPGGVLDYAVEAPSWPDRFVPLVSPGAADPALEADGVLHTQQGVVERARTRAELAGVGPGARVLVATDHLVTALVDALLVPLVVGGSAVLVRHEDSSGRPARLEQERVTVALD